MPVLLIAGLSLWAFTVHRKRPYTIHDNRIPSSPTITTCEDSSLRQSLERRALSDIGGHRQGTDSLPFTRVSQPNLARHRVQMDLLGIPGVTNVGMVGCNRRSGDLSMAAHAELVAAQVKDDALMGHVDEESLNSNFGGSSNHWRSSNTSSSSQTHAAMQRLTRLDTAAWQIAYNELKFSRLIGEGSFGRVFLGKWRETTVAIKLLTPTVPKADDSEGSDSDCELSTIHTIQSHRLKDGLLDDLDKEAGIMAALRHPNVVMFLGVCLEPPCMVAEVTLCVAFGNYAEWSHV